MTSTSVPLGRISNVGNMSWPHRPTSSQATALSGSETGVRSFTVTRRSLTSVLPARRVPAISVADCKKNELLYSIRPAPPPGVPMPAAACFSRGGLNHPQGDLVMGREAVERSGQGRLSGSPPFAAAAAGMTFRSPRLLDQCHEAMRVRHLARNT